MKARYKLCLLVLWAIIIWWVIMTDSEWISQGERIEKLNYSVKELIADQKIADEFHKQQIEEVETLRTQVNQLSEILRDSNRKRK